MAGTAQDPPALKRIIYDGSVIQASWDPATGSGKLFVITLFENGSAKISAQGYDRSGMLPVDRKSLDLAKTYTVKVAESDANLHPVGPYSNEIVLIPEAPSTVKADYDGVRITVSFTPPETAVEIEGGKLSLFEKSQSKLIQSVNFEGDSFIFKPSPPLKPSTGYFITVACQNPGSLGPASGPAEIVQDTVEIANVTYDGQTIKATASQTVPAPYLLVLRLYADGRFVKDATGKGNEVTLAPQDKLVLWKRYEVCMARFIENSRGPLSAPMPVLSTTPVLQGVSYDGAYLKASWQNLPGLPVPTGGALMIFQDETLVQSFDAQGNSACVQLPSALPDDKQNKLRVAATYGPSRGALSQPLDIITSVKQLTSAQYDGEKITAVWPSGTGYGVTGYLLSLLENGIEAIKQQAGGTTGTIDFRLNPNSNYSLSLQGTGYNTSGPDGTNPLIAAIPGIRTVVAKPDGVTVELDVVAQSPNVTGYVAYLYQGNKVVAGPVEAVGSPPTAVFNYTVSPQYSYSVKAQATGAKCSGPLSEAEEVIAGVPVIEEVDYDGVNAYISWSPVDGGAMTGYAVLLKEKSGGATQTFPTSLTSMTIPVDRSKSFSVQVNAIGDKSAGLPSQSVDIVSEAVSMDSAYYDGEFIRAAWPAAVIPGSEYEVLLLDGNDVSDSFTITVNNAAIPAVLDPGGAYSLKLRLAVDKVTGPGGASFSVVTAVPGIVSITAGDDNVSVGIDDSACKDKPGVTGCQAVLYRDGDVVAGPVEAAGSPLTAVFNYTVAPQYSYSVKVQAAGANCFGPFSDAVGVIAGVPVIEEVDYDGVNAYISWSQVNGGAMTGYAVLLKEKSGGATQTFPTPLTSITIPVDRSKSFCVQVNAIGDKSAGLPSQSVDIFSEAVSMDSAYYDGEFIRAAWPAATTPGAVYEVLLLDGNDVSDCFTFTANSAAIPAVLNPGGTYSLQLRLAVENVTGPRGATFPVVTAVPGIVSVTAGADNVSVVIDDSACKDKPGVTGCRAVLYRGGDIVAGPVEAAGSPLTAVFNYTVSQQYSYSVKVQAAGASCSGSWSGAADVIAGIPVIDTINYDELTAFISWSAVLHDSVTGYTLTLKEKSGGFKQNFSAAGTSISIPVDRTRNFSVQVQARSNYSLGRFSDAVDIVNESIGLNSAYYDGEFIRAAWPAASTPGAEYEVLLLDSNDVSDSFTVTVNNAAIPAVLDHGGTYSLKLRLAVDGVTGPGGVSFPVVSAVPGIVSVTAGADNVSVVIDDSACNGKPGVTGCRAVLYRGGDIVAGPVEAAGSPLTAVFNYTVSHQYSYSVKVQAAGSSCSGPWSGAADVIAGIPVIDTINYDELTAFISWSAVLHDSVTGYTLTLKEKSGGFKQNFSAAGTSISIPVDRTRNFSVQVQARSNYSLGRFSDAVDIINESIELTSVFYDGEIIMACWPAASTPDVSYIALLMDGDDLKGSHHTSTNSVVIPAFLDQGGSYSLKLRLLKDSVIGPCGGAFPVVSAVPGIVSVVAAADRVTVVIGDSACRGKPGITGYQAILYRGGDPVAGPVDASGSPLTASFDYAVSPQCGYSVKVRAAGANCSGPWSVDAAVIPAAPEIIEAVYSGSKIMVGWTPLATCPVTGYAATLTPVDDISKAITVYSSGTTAAIPFDASGASGAYTVSVRVLCDSSSGPASAPVDPIGPGLCLSSEKDKAPAVKPASNSLPPAPIEVACLLPELYKTPPSTLPSEGPFALTPLDGAGDLKYKIAFPPGSDVWSFDSSPLRAAIQQHYTKFISALEGKLPDQPPPTIGTLLPGAVQTVIESLARVMPQTFAETLYYNYGFYATYNYADLRPGMRLRLEYEQWQTVSSQSAGTTQYFNGYTGNIVAEYDIGSFTDSMGKQRVVFNSFLSNLDGLLVPTPKGSGAGPMDGGGGNIDFLFREFQQPFYRLFYPSTFKAPYEQGSCFPKDNAMIVAAADWTTLESITSAIIAGRGSSLPAIGANYAMFYLRGRTVMTPLICLTLNGARIWTPVGTILSQLLEQSAVRPLNVSSTISGLRYLRVWGGNYSATSQGLNFNIGRRLPVRFQWGASTVYANSSGWFSLPVLHGDIIEFTEERA